MYLAYTCYIQTVNSYGELSPQVTLKLEEWLDISENQVTESLLTQSDIMWMSAKWIWAVYFFISYLCIHSSSLGSSLLLDRDRFMWSSFRFLFFVHWISFQKVKAIAFTFEIIHLGNFHICHDMRQYILVIGFVYR